MSMSGVGYYWTISSKLKVFKHYKSYCYIHGRAGYVQTTVAEISFMTLSVPSTLCIEGPVSRQHFSTNVITL
jgi:hypothetical protein